MRKIWNRIRKAFAIHDVRQCSLNWWNKLTDEQQLELEGKFFTNTETGETTEADIQAMYLFYVA